MRLILRPGYRITCKVNPEMGFSIEGITFEVVELRENNVVVKVINDPRRLYNPGHEFGIPWLYLTTEYFMSD